MGSTRCEVTPFAGYGRGDPRAHADRSRGATPGRFHYAEAPAAAPSPANPVARPRDSNLDRRLRRPLYPAELRAPVSGRGGGIRTTSSSQSLRTTRLCYTPKRCRTITEAGHRLKPSESIYLQFVNPASDMPFHWKTSAGLQTSPKDRKLNGLLLILPLWRVFMTVASRSLALTLLLLTIGCGGDSDPGNVPDANVAPDGDVDASPDCREDADCDDGVFCNGAETCLENVCQPGEAPTVDDGIDCTVDSCDEEAGAIINEADNSLCPNGDAICTEDGASLVGQLGLCDVEAMGCVLQDGMSEDCTAVEATRSCEGDEIRVNVGFCQQAEGETPASCATRLDLVENCAESALPVASCGGDASSGDLSYSTYSAATCQRVADEPTCVPTEMVAACRAPADSCSDAELTQYAPTCMDASGCDTVASMSSCPDRRDRCSRGNLTTYEPTCADRESCGEPAASIRSCPDRLDSCTSGRLTQYTPACGSDSTCGSPTAAVSLCPDRTDSCRAGNLTTYTPSCSSRTSCGSPSAAVTSCPDRTNSCSGGRLTTYEPSCASATRCGTATGTTSTCPDRADSCSGGRLTTYEPSCASSSRCGSAAGTTSTCPDRANTCSGNRLTTYSPQCNASGTACGSARASTTECTGSYSVSGRTCTLTTSTCNAGAGRCDTDTTAWTCNDTPNRCTSSGGTQVWLRGSSSSCPGTASDPGTCAFGDPIGGPSRVTCSGTYREYCSGAFTLTRVSYTGSCSARWLCYLHHDGHASLAALRAMLEAQAERAAPPVAVGPEDPGVTSLSTPPETRASAGLPEPGGFVRLSPPGSAPPSFASHPAG